MPRKIVKKDLVNANPDERFWVHNGPVLSNLRDLEREISKMDDNTFFFHVNKNKNDFVAWIENSLGDFELARKLKRYKSKLPILNIISYHLSKYYK
jgi:hypothetical protein